MHERVAALGIDPSKIAQIPNWADGRELRPSDRDTNPLRAEWRIGGEFVVGYSGNMGRAHEFETVLEAAEGLRARTEIAFLLVGGGAQKADVESVRERELLNVVFKPHGANRSTRALAPPMCIWSRCAPSSKGSSSPASSTASRRSAGRRSSSAIRRERSEPSYARRIAGFCVGQGDAAGLVEAITALRDDPQLRGRMGANARKVLEELTTSRSPSSNGGDCSTGSNPCPRRVPCAAGEAFWSIERSDARLPPYLEENAQPIVYGLVIGKGLGDKRVQDDYVRFRGDTRSIFPADELAEVGALVLRT